MTCQCGAAATHRIIRWVPSNVGTARVIERGCTRCLEALAKSLLRDGLERVEVEVIR